MLTIGGSAFGLLIALGLAFLPTATLPEKALVFGAAVALSLATVTGIGGWRSVIRYTSTLALAGVALICMTCLAVIAQGADAHQASLTTPDPSIRPSTGAPGTRSSGSRSPAPTSSITSTAPVIPASQPLVDMTAINWASSGYASGPQKVNAKSYQQTLYDEYDDDSYCTGTSTEDVTYELDYDYTRFHAVVGLADTSASGDKFTFSLLVDGQKEGLNPTLGVGQTEVINVPVTGAFRITLQTSCTSPNAYDTSSSTGATGVWINPVVTRGGRHS